MASSSSHPKRRFALRNRILRQVIPSGSNPVSSCGSD